MWESKAGLFYPIIALKKIEFTLSARPAGISGKLSKKRRFLPKQEPPFRLNSAD
jgi:hypothetical protein